MSSEESYLAIQRYLTDEREPYAPGTQGNAKRKIRKAATCYVVRNGTLYYQRRQKGLDEFTELEVVLQAGRRKELIDEAHITAGGEHLNQHQTWDTISQKYWWRGILKQVKDYIRECAQCQGKQERVRGWAEETTGAPLGRRRGRRRATPAHDSDEENEEEEEEDVSLSEQQSIQKSSKSPSATAKHELVFVDSKGIVKQFLPKHGQTTLDKLNQQRLQNQFCDITLLIEGEAFRAHKSVLAACSDYFSQLFVEKGAVSSHEAVVDLSGFSKSSFLPLLEFAYTSSLSFNFCVMAEVATLARHLLMAEVLQLCESVHKQVEEQKLMVYQKGDVHTVVSSPTLTSQAPSEEGGTYVVTVHTDGQAVMTESLAVVAPSGDVALGESLAVVTPSGDVVAGEPIAVVTPDGDVASAESLAVVTSGGEVEAGESLAMVIQGAEVGAGETLAVVSACWPAEESQAGNIPAEAGGLGKGPEPGAFIISVDPGKVAPTEVVRLAATAPSTAQEEVPDPAPAPPRRKRGRPAKVKQEVVLVEEPAEVQESSPAPKGAPEVEENLADDTYKSRLRQRSLGEGEYVRMHMGLEGQQQDRKAGAQPPRSAVQKVAQRLVKRGRLIQPTRKREAGTGAEEQAATGVPEPEGGAEGEHTCAECGLVFQRRYDLIMHTLKHEKTRGYKCNLCNKEFQYAASLRAHLARHKRQKSQRTAAAGRAPLEDEDAGDSKAKGRTKREFVCDICGKTLPKLYSLRIHMLNHTGVRPHTCRVCGKSFAHKHSLKMHRALHDALKQFHCTLCDKSFVSKRSLEEHTSIHTGESKYLCTTCGKSFHRASGLSKHLKRHQPRPEVRGFPCSHCDKSFYEAKDLQQHMNKHLGLKPFQCQVCGKCYSWKKDWYSHVKSHSVAEPFKCNICGKEFFEKALFRRHVKKATHGKKGRVKQNLERECEHCGRKFTQLREYRRHINNHQGVKPFECLTCGVAWADARSLKRHVRTHTGERPYVCPVCQDAHIDARTLRKHMTKYHGDYIPGKIMLEKDTLQFHNQGTQVEHAISILAPDLPPELQPPNHQVADEEIETVLVTEETVEAVQAVVGGPDDTAAAVSTLSDQSIMQVVNYVLSQQAAQTTGPKLEEGSPHAPDLIQTVEVEVAHVAEVE
ncbi:zinc finger and BTB domain-containing protein 11 [Megalops cyprinoides]|uniref:zinc finger and BTB domain-containing protein 11 n=1 Tax=Megalops cyprinoides TaxID=118141 RepID=UPI00186436A0|nr:zinc finger and BTB domain-containing protein 11 [Megalops cyprinoides]